MKTGGRGSVGTPRFSAVWSVRPHTVIQFYTTLVVWFVYQTRPTRCNGYLRGDL